MGRLIALQAETVIVADDHPLFRTAIKKALEAEQGETNFLEANVREANTFQRLDELTGLDASCKQIISVGCTQIEEGRILPGASG